MGRDIDALEEFERFLSDTRNGDAAIGARRDEAARHVSDLRRRVGLVDVVGSVRDAEVLVDGRTRGRTPLPAALPVTPGPHQVTVRKPGHEPPFSDQIEIAAGERIRVQAHLAPGQSPTRSVADTLAVTSVPSAHKPLYQRWWLWAGVAVVGAVVAGALVVGSGNKWCDGCGGTFPVSQ
jgi:hypothetical protein